LYQKAGNLGKSLKYYKDHITYRDSVTNIKSVQQMADLRTNYEVSQKQIEVDLLEKDSEIQKLKEKRQKNIIYATVISLFLIFLLALGLYRRYKFIKKTNRIIEEERNRSDSLLLNILPEETAHELKQSGKVRAKRFESVTVLFTDFEGFTQYAEKLSPEKLVESVDFYFSKFDAIIEKYGLEKIKTVGDAYMCAGGLPFPTSDHANKMVLAAFEIAEFVTESKRWNTLNQTRFEIRIGISTGPVVAGVVGTKKFAYDIWGDTVNIASRMESNSVPGKINISESTYDIIKGSFECEYRGEIEVKNKGMMKMYFVNNLAS
jgi:class 3 adenylate cyclase